jgi:hypothetical protein
VRARCRRIPDGLFGITTLARALLLASTVLSLPGQAAESGLDLRVGAGVDIVHEQGMAVASLKAGPFTVLAYDRIVAAGITRDFGRREGWSSGIGAIVVSEKSGEVGTHLNFLLRLSYCHGEACLSYAHVSHGEGLGIAKNRPNAGLNFLMLEYRHQ